MFSRMDDEDDDFLSPIPGPGQSKLASLFGVNQSSEQSGNASLTYTAPTEPKKTKPADPGGNAQSSSSSSSSSSLLCACAVHAYKFIDGEYKSQGKLGSAIIGSHSPPEYRLLLYVSKQQQTTNARITSAFTFTVQANNYASFYDDTSERTSWSLMFETEQSISLFIKQIALCKANIALASSSLDQVISQDMSVFSDPRVDSGDSVEVRYTAWLLENHAVGSMFDSNANAEKLLRFKVGRAKTIAGLDAGVVGMGKAGKRFLVIPAALGYGADGKSPKVPANAILLYEVEVVRVKFSKEKEDLSTSQRDVSPAPTSTPPTKTSQPPVTSDDTDDGVKARSRTLSETLSQPMKTDKAKLISRMAKMGQPMLPPGGRSRSQSHTDEDNEEAPPTPTSVESHKPELPVKPPRQSSMTPPHDHSSAHTTTSAHANPIPAQAIIVGGDPHQGFAQPIGQQSFGGQPIGGYPVAVAQGMQNPMMANPNIMQGVPMNSHLSVYQQPMPGGQPGYAVPGYGNIYGAQPPYQPAPPQPQPQPAAAATPPVASSDPSLPILLSETRQQNTELRLTLSKMADKVDQMHQKVDMMSSQHANALALPGAVPNTETTILLGNIQRIIQENERLKKDMFEKSSRIESQNDKIADLLQRNQQFVEQSNVMMEQRNDSFKSTTAHSQARVLSLEQEKVQLTSDLSSAVSQVGKLQLEISTVRKHEMELQQQLGTVVSSDQSHRDAITSLKLSDSENARKLEQFSSQVKEERHLRKSLELELNTLREEIAESQASKDTLEKNMAEKKKKSAEEKKKLEEELDDQRGQHEKEVADLKEKLRQQKTSKDAASAQQVKDIEAEINRDWQTKCDRLVSAANELHKKELLEVKEELDKQQQLYKSQEGKLASTKTSREASEKRILSLEEQIEDLGVWKDKYEKLRSQASTMKERYEQRITELEETSQRTLQAGKRVAEERDAAVKRVGEVQEKARDAMRVLREEAAKKGASGGGGDSSGEVKKIMNSVFRDLKSKFDAKKSYSGGDIQAQVLATIKEVTLQMIQVQKAPRDSGVKQVEEAEDQDGDEEEEEETDEEEEDAETEDSDDDEEEEEEDANKDVAETEVILGEEESIDGDKKDIVQQTTKGDKEITVTEALVKTGEDGEEGLIQNSADVVNQKDTPNEVPNQAHQSDIHNSIKDQSEVQTSPPIVQGKMTDSAEDEGGEHPADTEARDAGGDEAQASQSDADDSSLTDTDTDDPKGAISDPSLVIEEVMKEMSHISGDSGNPHYAAELDRTSDSAAKSALEDSIAAMMEPSTDSTSKESDKASKDLESRIAGMIEPTVSPSSKAAGEGTRKTESPIKPATSHVTGDKGNPHYAKELEKSQGMSSVEARIESLIVPEGVVDNKGGAPGKTGVESHIEASKSNLSGDKGNPHYAKELGAASKLEAQIAGLIVTGEGKPSKTDDDTAKTDDGHVKASAAHSTGDKGNPHYAKQLEAGSKLEAQIEGLIVSNTGEEKPSTLKDKGGAGKTEDVIKASASHSTGDKGNPHYAKQLEDSNPSKLEASIAGLLVSETGSPKVDEGKTRSEESAIKPISSHTTGDKGNIHYAEELKKGDKKKDLESRIESLIQPESGSSSKQTSKLESQIESMIIPQTEGGNTDKGRGNKSKTEAAITPDSAHVTGDKGNIHYAKELEKSQDSKSSKSSLESQIESLIVTDALSDKADSGKKKSSSEGKGASDLESKLEGLFDSGFEASIKEEKSHITGDKGNQHYKKELDKSGGKDGGSETADSAEASRKAKAALALFGNDEDEDGFSFLQKPADKVTKKATPDKKTSKQSKTEDDDTTRPRPPPLFGDSDDDDGELDWLS